MGGESRFERGLLSMNDHFNSVQFAASLSGLGPLHLYAGRNTVASRFRCQPCGCGYIVRGLDDESAEQAYAAIRRWMNVRGYRPAGAKRELNHGQMLEIRFPVAQNWFNRESLGSDWNSFLIKPVASWFVFSCRLSAQLQRMDYFSSPRRRFGSDICAVSKMARVGVETKHSAGHALTAMREASFGESNLLEPSTPETARAP